MKTSFKVGLITLDTDFYTVEVLSFMIGVSIGDAKVYECSALSTRQTKKGRTIIDYWRMVRKKTIVYFIKPNQEGSGEVVQQ